MLQSNYQRVGALAGLLLFLGAWLTGYYNNWVWPFITITAVVVAFWVALDSEVEEELGTRVTRGLVVGLLAAVVARLLGLVTMAWAYDNWSSPVTASYNSLSDAFRIIFNGEVVASLLFILATGALGAFIAYALPYFVAEKEEE
jgi:hypothetical protein